MSNNRWKDLAELVGIFAIVASLIFVGVELQQTRKIAIADVYQQRAAMNIELINSRCTVGISCRNNDLFILFAIIMGQFSDTGCFS